MNRLIHNVLLFTNDENSAIRKNQAVAIEGSRIAEVGEANRLKEKYAHYQQLDGQGRFLMPGLINTHMHFYSTFARGIALPRAPKNFAEILSLLWWKLDSSLDLEAVYYSALLPAILAVKKGVTTLIDHHASPFAVDGSLDRIEEALREVGLRGVLCYEVSDRTGKEIAKKGIQENQRYIQKCLAAARENPDYPYRGMVGLHASFTVDDDTLEQAAALSAHTGCGCHIHVLEDGVDEELSLKKYGLPVVERLVKSGVLAGSSIAAHCIHLSESQKDLLSETGTMVAHNPQSNMNNAVGRTDIPGLMARGLTVGLGTDGMSADLRPDIRAAALVHKHDLKNYNVGWNEIQKMVLRNNPEIVERVTGQKVGCVRPGYLADLILVDYFPPTPIDRQSFWGHFLFGIIDAEVDTVIINGKVVMKHRELANIDEREIARKALPVAKRVWERFYQ